jgi:hypothetical protein
MYKGKNEEHRVGDPQAQSHLTLLRTTDVETDAHRLIRDRHRRQILNRLRHRKNERCQRGKDDNYDVLEHSELGETEKNLSVIDPEQWRRAELTLCLARVIHAS